MISTRDLSDELRRQAEDLLGRLARESQELRGDKTDRKALAALFTEMAMRLNGEFRFPASRGRAGCLMRPPPPPPGPGGGPAEPVTEFAELRSLIIGPEQRELRDLEARISDPGRVARDVSAVLPEAVLLRNRPPPDPCARADNRRSHYQLRPQNPQPLADALFPVIGPAIRKAIAASLSGMLDTLNRTLEHSVSWRAVQWRITALRTGRSFAEVVLLNTLVYRVEQVLLIDRRTGLLLQHVTEGPTPAQDADMVSGMLTAIRDFAHDSFRVEENEALETLQVGDVTVWVEQGPYAILAAMIRGTAPRELRTALQETLEYVHAYHGEALRGFSGDAAPFDSLRPSLEGLLHAQYRRPEKPVSPLIWIGLAILVLAGRRLAGIRRSGPRTMERLPRRAPGRARHRRGLGGASRRPAGRQRTARPAGA